VLRQLNHILNSNAFQNAARLRAFLSFVVNESLSGRQAAIKEYTIGREVCGRSVSFDPKADPIVRVDANRLRSRLDVYYETEGARDSIRITLPKGTYVPVFKECAAPKTEAGQNSLAVLPFVNLGPAGEHDYFADSLTEELIHSLARLGGIRVIARSSVFFFKGRAENARDIGVRLNVDHLLEGSIRVSGERLRIAAQLTDVHRGWLLWSDKFECVWHNVFTVQDEIVASITDALRIRLTGESGSALFAHVTENVEAYAEYLRGRYFWNQRTPESLCASIRCYEQALGHDPQCAPAYSGIADSLMVMALNDQEPTLTLMPRARAAVHKAIEVRPGWPEALASRGSVRSVFDWDWQGGARDFEEAIRRNPGASHAHYLYVIVNLTPCGRWTEAIAALQSALRLDPVSSVLWRDLGLLHFMRRAWRDAEQAWSHAESLTPGFRGCLYWRARLAIETGRFCEAIAMLEARRAASPDNTRLLATTAYALARRGAIDEAQSILKHLTERARKGRVPALDFAVVFLGLCQPEQALDWLERACEERTAALYQFAVDPQFDSLRGQPRAEALRLALGLPLVIPG
jgi:serine/threonine-protein kinase